MALNVDERAIGSLVVIAVRAQLATHGDFVRVFNRDGAVIARVKIARRKRAVDANVAAVGGVQIAHDCKAAAFCVAFGKIDGTAFIRVDISLEIAFLRVDSNDASTISIDGVIRRRKGDRRRSNDDF